jgi:hypothetical protein
LTAVAAVVALIVAVCVIGVVIANIGSSDPQKSPGSPVAPAVSRQPANQ